MTSSNSTPSELCRVYELGWGAEPSHFVLDDADESYIGWFWSFEAAQRVADQRNDDHRRRCEMQMWSV